MDITYGVPNEHHTLLGRMVGDWKVSAKMFGPDGQVVGESSGTAEIRWMLGNLFVEEFFHGNMGGVPVEGHNQTGFDNSKGKYVAAWSDSMSSGLILSEGQPDPNIEGFTTVGSMYHPMSGQRVVAKFITRLLEDHHTTEMFVTFLGAPGPMKVMESTYTK